MIRGFEDSDFPARSRLAAQVSSDLDADESRIRVADEEDLAAGRALRRFVWEEAGEVLAYGLVRELAFFAAPGRRMGRVVVDPAARGRGIGGALLDHLLDVASEQGAREVILCGPDSPAAQALAASRGFVEVDVEVVMRLEPVRCDREALRLAREALAARGVTVTTLAELRGVVSDWLDRYYELVATLQSMIPTAHGQANVPDLDAFVNAELEDPGHRDEATWIARHEDRWIGMTEIRLATDGRGQQELTGVVDPYRRRGIATVLKRIGLAWADDQGLSAVFTGTNRLNVGMQRLNEALGFVVTERWPMWCRTLP